MARIALECLTDDFLNLFPMLRFLHGYLASSVWLAKPSLRSNPAWPSSGKCPALPRLLPLLILQRTAAPQSGFAAHPLERADSAHHQAPRRSYWASEALLPLCPAQLCGQLRALLPPGFARSRRGSGASAARQLRQNECGSQRQTDAGPRVVNTPREPRLWFVVCGPGAPVSGSHEPRRGGPYKPEGPGLAALRG